MVRPFKVWKVRLMKMILLFLCAGALLTLTGCIIWSGHDHGDRRGDWQHRDGDRYSTGVDHGTHPGDLDQRERR